MYLNVILHDANIHPYSKHIGVIRLRQVILEDLHCKPKGLLLGELHLQQESNNEIHPLTVPDVRIADSKVPQHPTQTLPLRLLQLRRTHNILLNGIGKILRVLWRFPQCINSLIIVRIFLDPTQRTGTQQPNGLPIIMRT